MTKKKVEARRRRRTEPGQSGERERASAPSRGRPRDAQQPARPSSQGATSRPTGSAPQIPIDGLLKLLGGGKLSLPMIIGLVAILAVCACVYVVFLAPPTADESLVVNVPTQPDVVSQPTVISAPTRTPRPFVPPSLSSEGGQTWLVMLYQDADDKILEQDIYLDLNEAERIGSSDRVHIVAQVDRFRTGYRGDGDWSSTKRFYLTLDPDLKSVSSQEVADLGEVNMADGDTLVDFVTWAIETFPADKHVLILSDHGMGWPGGWTDPAPGGKGDDNVALADMGDQLFLMEMDEALQEIRDRAGLDQFELIGLDACLMGHLEVLAALAPHARYAVVSQETEPALGWAYTGFLGALRDDPGMDGAELGRIIVESYIQEDQRIVDDQARAEFLSRGSPLSSLFGVPSAEQLAQQMQGSVTLAAVDLQAMPELMNRTNDLAYALQGANQDDVAKARSYAQSFTSVFGKEVPPSYLDLGNLAQLLKAESGSREVAQAADELLAALDRAIVTEKHGSKKPAAGGISIYFPNSQLYQSRYAGYDSYTTVARRFAVESLWDDFLAYHYTGKAFEPAAGVVAVPERDATIAGPGVGEIEVDPVTLSAAVVAPGQTIRLSTDIRGDNVGYVLLFVGFFDAESNSIFVADQDYLESDETREIDGVYYPDWGDEGEFTMEFEWEPIVFAIDDGSDSVVALFRPEVYGASPEEAVYTVEGTYTYADDGQSRYARLYFSDGVLKQVFGFTGEGGTGAPREIIPSTGDTFTVLDTWMDLDQRGRVEDTVTLQGGTLTFGDQMFSWEALDAAPGQYIVGFVVQDLDGNSHESFDLVTVE
ncbi:MAG: clostripain-related cysteine peptidase [Anaerolineae bacterium]|nr:clostripain-related cysteine peptidase [Anaerolineae bacterium]